jgi:hypothetical protein
MRYDEPVGHIKLPVEIYQEYRVHHILVTGNSRHMRERNFMIKKNIPSRWIV